MMEQLPLFIYILLLLENEVLVQSNYFLILGINPSITFRFGNQKSQLLVDAVDLAKLHYRDTP